MNHWYRLPLKRTDTEWPAALKPEAQELERAAMGNASEFRAMRTHAARAALVGRVRSLIVKAIMECNDTPSERHAEQIADAILSAAIK